MCVTDWSGHDTRHIVVNMVDQPLSHDLCSQTWPACLPALLAGSEAQRVVGLGAASFICKEVKINPDLDSDPNPNADLIQLLDFGGFPGRALQR